MAKYGVLALACLLAVVSAASAANVTLVTGLPVSGFFYIQSFTSSSTLGAGATVPGGGSRRLLESSSQNTLRSLLQQANVTFDQEVSSTLAAANALLAGNSGRKLLQYGSKYGTTTGLQISYAAVVGHSGRATVLLEFPASAGNAAILSGLATQQPTGVALPPATFFNAEVALGTSVAVSKTGFVSVSGGVVRVRLSFDLFGASTLPQLQISWQYASNIAGAPAFFFLNSANVVVVPDKLGLPTLKGLIGTLEDVHT